MHIWLQEVIYRCRKCRRLVATSANEAPMYMVKAAGEGAPQFAGKRMNGKDLGLAADHHQQYLYAGYMSYAAKTLS